MVEHLLDPVRCFFERDDNSRVTTSKRVTKSQKGVKRQRRVLLDTMKEKDVWFAVTYSKMDGNVSVGHKSTSKNRSHPSGEVPQGTLSEPKADFD